MDKNILLKTNAFSLLYPDFDYGNTFKSRNVVGEYARADSSLIGINDDFQDKTLEEAIDWIKHRDYGYGGMLSEQNNLNKLALFLKDREGFESEYHDILLLAIASYERNMMDRDDDATLIESVNYARMIYEIEHDEQFGEEKDNASLTYDYRGDALIYQDTDYDKGTETAFSLSMDEIKQMVDEYADVENPEQLSRHIKSILYESCFYAEHEMENVNEAEKDEIKRTFGDVIEM